MKGRNPGLVLGDEFMGGGILGFLRAVRMVFCEVDTLGNHGLRIGLAKGKSEKWYWNIGFNLGDGSRELLMVKTVVSSRFGIGSTKGRSLV